ncbi:hypothetical protein ACLMJK_009664 [Lecanora helva]
MRFTISAASLSLAIVVAPAIAYPLAPTDNLVLAVRPRTEIDGVLGPLDLSAATPAKIVKTKKRNVFTVNHSGVLTARQDDPEDPDDADDPNDVDDPDDTDDPEDPDTDVAKVSSAQKLRRQDGDPTGQDGPNDSDGGTAGDTGDGGDSDGGGDPTGQDGPNDSDGGTAGDTGGGDDA